MKTLWPHQIQAIQAILKGLQLGPDVRGQNIAACGTGKTLVHLRVHEELKSQNTLVLVPSLHLMAQVQEEWLAERRQPYAAFSVCSDVTVLDGAREMAPDYGFDPTTTPEEIAEFLKGPGPKVVFCTYQSSPKLTKAQELPEVPSFDLTICDEAHRVVTEIDSTFATILSPKKIRSQRRLFSTATPKIYKASAKARWSCLSMDDEEVFGPVLHRYTFGQAIEDRILADYRVIVMTCSDEDLASMYLHGALKPEDGSATEMASKVLLAKAIEKYELQRTLAFVNRVKTAREYGSATTNNSLKEVSKYLNSLFLKNLWTGHVSGQMSHAVRKDHLKDFCSAHGPSVLFNARCLGEGVDVPSLDGIAFLDPRQSHIDIMQAIGRVLRIPRGWAPTTPDEAPPIGTVIVPIMISESGDDAEISLGLGPFRPLARVFSALRAHDENFFDTFHPRPASEDANGSPSTKTFPPHPLSADSPPTGAVPSSKIFVYDLEGNTPKIELLCQKLRASIAHFWWDKPPLTKAKVLEAVMKYVTEHGERPKTQEDASAYFGYPERWGHVDRAGYGGFRGLPKGFTLRRAAEELGLVPPFQEEREKAAKKAEAFKNLTTRSEVFTAIRAYAREHENKGPTKSSQNAARYFGREITWGEVHAWFRKHGRKEECTKGLVQAVWELRLEAEGHPLLTKNQVLLALRRYREDFGTRPAFNEGDASKYLGCSISWKHVIQACDRGWNGLPDEWSWEEAVEEARNTDMTVLIREEMERDLDEELARAQKVQLLPSR